MAVESGGDKDIKQERKFAEKKGRKIRLESRVIWKRKTRTEDERKLRKQKNVKQERKKNEIK
jgi:ribosome maturation factor RimP